jgi:hypothetical protein
MLKVIKFTLAVLIYEGEREMTDRMIKKFRNKEKAEMVMKKLVEIYKKSSHHDFEFYLDSHLKISGYSFSEKYIRTSIHIEEEKIIAMTIEAINKIIDYKTFRYIKEIIREFNKNIKIAKEQ